MISVRLPYMPPEDAFAAFSPMTELVFLDSSAAGDPRAKVSYLCLSPVAVLSLGSDPFNTLRTWMQANARPRQIDAWPFAFCGGAVGWFGYDLARDVAGVESRFTPMDNLPAGWFGLYDTVLGFDVEKEELFYLGPSENLTKVTEKLSSSKVFSSVPAIDWKEEMQPDEYKRRHEKLRSYIAAGDLYQANLTMRFTAPSPEAFELSALYVYLRQRSPAPFSACLLGDGFGLACASPERFLRLSANGFVETRPIKGTAARHVNPKTDLKTAEELQKNPKERAENLMIVDLLRNDLGQVCKTGSVAVPELWQVESYAQAHHLVSSVTGQLREGADAYDLLAATLPGGSITGAPKRRAMQIIDELEEGPRGAYCGALAWIGFDGAMDSAIIIRTITQACGMLYAQAGGGITWDSLAEAEYEEAMIKISPLLAMGA